MCQRNGSSPLTTLASLDALGAVQMCACGTVHVHVGSVSLRLSPETFCELAVLCRAAADTLLHHSRLLDACPAGTVQ